MSKYSNLGDCGNAPKTISLFKYLLNIRDDLSISELRRLVSALLNLTYAVADDRSELNDELVYKFQYALHVVIAILKYAQEDGCLSPNCIGKVVSILRRIGELTCGDSNELVSIIEEVRSIYEHEQAYSYYWRA